MTAPMTKDDAPSRGPKTADPRRMTREDRLKAALKANMARRKAQARRRAEGAEPQASESGGPESDGQAMDGQAGADPQDKE